MAKKNKSTVDPSLRDDPRVRDVVMWNRLRLAAEKEVLDRAWGCELYRLHRIGWLTDEQREAGDRYHTIVMNYRDQQQIDPDDWPEDELLPRRIRRARDKYDDATEILGRGRRVIDWMVLEDNCLTEAEKYTARDALQLLANFFNFGKNKRATKVLTVGV